MTDRRLIRSYRQVFLIERRLYKLDPWRDRAHIPWAGGIPLLGIIYFFAIAAAMFPITHLPLVGVILTTLFKPLILYAIIPGTLAYLGFRWRPDGLKAHRWLWAMFVYYLIRYRPRPRAKGNGKVTIAHDKHYVRLRKAWIHGPAIARFTPPVAFSLSAWRTKQWVARPSPNGNVAEREISVGERLDVRGERKPYDLRKFTDKLRRRKSD